MEIPFIDYECLTRTSIKCQQRAAEEHFNRQKLLLKHVLIGHWNCPFHLVNIITHGMEVNLLILS